jgi:hypothetical protein
MSPLHINDSSSIIACVFVAAGMCLPSRCLVMDVCSGSTIPAFRRHVTVWFFTAYQVISFIRICQRSQEISSYRLSKKKFYAIRVKGKVPVLNWVSTVPWRRVGEWRYSCTIPDLGTRWRWVVSLTRWRLYHCGKSPWYPLNRTLGGPQSRFWRCGVEKNMLPLTEIEPRLSSP